MYNSLQGGWLCRDDIEARPSLSSSLLTGIDSIKHCKTGYNEHNVLSIKFLFIAGVQMDN